MANNFDAADEHMRARIAFFHSGLQPVARLMAIVEAVSKDPSCFNEVVDDVVDGGVVGGQLLELLETVPANLSEMADLLRRSERLLLSAISAKKPPQKF